MRLIDANVLEKLLSERANALADEHGWHDHYTTGFDDARTYVEVAPTIDAVPVVRCRDCKHARPFRDGFVACIAWIRAFNCDGFCHMGAKMDGGAADA